MSKDAKNVPTLRFKGYSDAWEKRKLREVSDVRDGTHASPKYYSQGYPLVTSKNLTSAGLDFSNISLISELDYKNINKRSRVDKGDILFGMIGTIGTPVMVHESNFGIKNVALIKEREAVLNSFLVQLLKSPAFINYIRNENVGGTQKFLSLNTIRNFRFSFPTSKEQAMVSRFLEKIDSLIAATQDKIDALEQAKRALLQRLFDQSWRFKGYSDPWEKRKLGELAEFINGRAYKQDELLASGKYPVLRVGNFYTNDKWYYSNLELPEKYYAEEGDLLYTWSATFGPHIWIGPRVIYHYHIWKVALKNIFEKDFALQFFEADRVRLLNSTNGSTMIHVTKKDMESKGVLLPDVYEQRTIGDLLKRVDHLIAATQSRLSSLELLKKALLQDLFI